MSATCSRKDCPTHLIRLTLQKLKIRTNIIRSATRRNVRDKYDHRVDSPQERRSKLLSLGQGTYILVRRQHRGAARGIGDSGSFGTPLAAVSASVAFSGGKSLVPMWVKEVLETLLFVPLRSLTGLDREAREGSASSSSKTGMGFIAEQRRGTKRCYNPRRLRLRRRRQRQRRLGRDGEQEEEFR